MNIVDDFIETTLVLSDDYEGEVVATLISAKSNSANRKSVLYLHGYVDYFFQAHLAEAFVEKGYNFYALDLRKHGRSLLPHQHPNYFADVEEFYEEITMSIEIIKEESSEALYLLGHSTGGLIASNYMVNGSSRSQIKALMLNSPFLEIKFPHILRRPLFMLSALVSSVAPYAKFPAMFSVVYGESAHKDFHGEWDYNLAWKPMNGFDLYYKWMRGIIGAQDRLGKGDIEVPILVMHAEQSLDLKKYSVEAQSADTVLVVEDMQRIGAELGDEVTLITVKEGMHDLFLSKPAVRTLALSEMLAWLECH